MSVGERGGRTVTLDQGIHLIEQHKWSISDRVRADILNHLRNHPEWHRDDLRVELSPADKNVLGAVVNGLLRSGLIEETGERRKSSDPASHSRKSNVYRLQRSASGVPGNTDDGDKGSVNVGAVESGGDEVGKNTSVTAGFQLSLGFPDGGYYEAEAA